MVALPVFSIDRSSVSCAICALSRASATSLPVTSCDRKNCMTTKTESRNTMPRTSVDNASTKPGQYSMPRSRRARASAMAHLLLFEHDLFRKPVPTFRDHALYLVDVLARQAL